MNVEELIKNIVSEILPLINKRVLIFISGGIVNAEGLMNTLAGFELINYNIVISEAAKSIVCEELIKKLKANIIDSMDKLNDAVNNSEFILIPVLTRNTLSKVALGIEDNLLTTGIAHAIMLNKEVIAVRDSYDPNNVINISEGFSNNPAYNLMLLNYEKTLEGFGVKIIDSCEFRGIIQNKLYNSSSETIVREKIISENKPKDRIKFNSSILTVKDINQILNKGVITIKEGTIITPLAKDYIHNNKIEVEFYK